MSRLLVGNLTLLFAPFRCDGLDYLSNWALEVVVIPCGITACLWLTYRWSAWRLPERKVRYSKDFKKRLSLGLFLLYPSLCSQIFSLMQCRSLGDNKSWLRADMSVPCKHQSIAGVTDLLKYKSFFSENTLADRYHSYLRLAYVLAILVPIGIPLALLAQFFREWRRDKKEFVEQTEMIMQSDDDCMASVRAGEVQDLGAKTASELTYLRLMPSYSTLISDYKPDFFYFELVDFLRKSIFTGFLIFVDQGFKQLFAGSFVALSFLLLQVVTNPFKRRAHNWMKNVELLALLLTFQVCLVVKVHGGKTSKCTLYGKHAVSCMALYDGVLVSIVGLMLFIFVASTALAVCRSKLLRKQIGAIDATGLLDESSIRQGAAMREQEWQARRASDEKKRAASTEQEAAHLPDPWTEPSQDVAPNADTMIRRKQSTEKRNTLAKEHRMRREKDDTSSEGSSNVAVAVADRLCRRRCCGRRR